MPINPAYRHGKARVGCVICPFSTSWDDSIINRLYPSELKPFVDKIEEFAAGVKIKDVRSFIRDRKWKLKILGSLKTLPQIKITEYQGSFVAEITNAKQPLFSWLGALCDYTVKQNGDNYSGDLQFKNSTYHYTLYEDIKKGIIKFTVNDITDLKIKLLLRRVINKVGHCINCEACEVDCPTGALFIVPTINIDKTKCIHCHKCINVHDRGCIVADCNRMVKDLDSNTKINGYKKFGFREEWLDDFMSAPEYFWKSQSWGAPMYDAFKRWGKDAQLLDSKNELTDLGKLLHEIYNNNPSLVWEILWINLSYNSFIVNRFCSLVPFHKSFTSKSIQEDILAIENVSSAATLSNACVALYDFLDKSPIGEDCAQGISDGRQKIRKSHDYLSIEAIAYSLFKYAETHDIREFRLSNLYDIENQDGIYRQFGISKPQLIKALNVLSSHKERILIAELNMGLDHITLSNDIDSISVLKKLAM